MVDFELSLMDPMEMDRTRLIMSDNTYHGFRAKSVEFNNPTTRIDWTKHDIITPFLLPKSEYLSASAS